MSTHFSGGFANLPIDSALCFRGVLTALSRPGTPVDLSTDASPPEPLRPLTGALLVTLADAEAPVFLAPDLATLAVSGWLRFHSGAGVISDPAAAVFAVATASSDLAFLQQLPIGTAEYPDRSATLIMQVDRFDGPVLALTGPGIASKSLDCESGAPAAVVDMLRRNRLLYPLGLDVLIVSPHAVIGIPRSTLIAETGAR